MTSIEKLKVRERNGLPDLDCLTLQAAKEVIENQIKELGPDAEIDIYYAGDEILYNVISYREETNAEMNIRLEREKYRNEQNKLLRLNQYKRLKEEFGE